MQNLGNKVPIVLDADNRSYSSVVFEPLKPPLNQEFNLLQDIYNERIATLLKNTHQSGFLKIGAVTTRPSTGGVEWKHTIKFKNPIALINGWLLNIGAGTNQFQSGAIDNIWKTLSNDENEVALILGDGPSTASRDDLVFLEVWEELLSTSSTVYKYGFVQSGVSAYSNDLIDPNIGLETSLRTQVRYRIRIVEGVDFITYLEGIDHPAVHPQGSKTLPNINYTFTKTDAGHYISGNGNSQSSSDLGSVDGYVYALPLFAVHRKNKSPYSIANTNGASVGIGGVSDRPDGVFSDEIDFNSLEDLRHLLVLDDELESICDETLFNVLKASPDRLGLGANPQAFSKVNIDVDGISESVRPNISGSLLRRPNGYQKTFSDKEITQRTITYIQSGALDGAGNLLINPPVFFTIADQDTLANFNSFNPYIGTGKIPRVYNASTGAEVIGVLSFGNQGWVNLGDKFNKGTVRFKPQVPSEITGQPLMVEYDLVIPSGTGLNNVPKNVYSVSDDVTNRTISFTVDGETRVVNLSRNVNNFFDSEIYRPVTNYQSPTSLNEKFRAGSFERVYHIAGNGTSKVTIPATLDDTQQSVFSVLRVQYASTTGDGADIPLGIGITPKVRRLPASGGFEINFNNYFPSGADTIRVTLLIAGTNCEVMPFNKGIGNFVKTYMHQIISTGASIYTITPSSISGSNYADFVYAIAGIYESNALTQGYCYVGTSLAFAFDLTRINSTFFESDGSGRRITINFTTPPPAGRIIQIPLLVSFAPSTLSAPRPSTTENMYTVTYDSVPYNGLTNVLSPEETLEAEVIYISKKALVLTSGTGGNSNSSPQGIDSGSTRLPINIMDKDSTLTNDNLMLPHSSNATGSLKFVDYYYREYLHTKMLEVGDTLTIQKRAEGDAKLMRRGGSLNSPLISYGVEDLMTWVEEDITDQVTGSNVFKVNNKIMSVLGTDAVSLVWLLNGGASFTNGDTTVSGTDAFFTKQLKKGFLIRPVGTSTWYRIIDILDDNNLLLSNSYAGSSVSGQFELFLPQFEIFVDGVRKAFEMISQLDGSTGVFVIDGTHPDSSSVMSPSEPKKVSVRYKTSTNTMNVLYGLAVGKGQLNNQLLLFTLTTTSNTDVVNSINTNNYNLSKEGSANKLIFNNNLEVITSVVGSVNEANRVIIAADLFYTKNRRLLMNQKV